MDKKCAKCKYVNRSNRFAICDYLGMTGHLRGCKADADCDKYEPRKKKKRLGGNDESI
jgi:hypothetical protein